MSYLSEKSSLICISFNQVTDKLQALNDEFAAMTKKKKDLEDNIELCSQKLDRAEKLILGLGGERDRWSEMAVNLGSKLTNITGDVLMASGMVAYLGAFDVVYRKAIINEWQVNEMAIRSSKPKPVVCACILLSICNFHLCLLRPLSIYMVSKLVNQNKTHFVTGLLHKIQNPVLF